MDSITLSQQQIDQMKHCIGYRSYLVRGRKRPRYEAYRNHYATTDDSKFRQHWEELVANKLATREQPPESAYIIYSLTKAGMTALGEVLHVKITESD